MDMTQIIYLSIEGAAFLVTLVTTIIGFIKAHKAKKNAKTTEEAAAAKQQMLDEANKLISEAEIFYKTLDTALKATDGTSAGPYKKESVMTKLEAFAMTIGFKFDKEFWSAKVDEIVKLTKEVNSK